MVAWYHVLGKYIAYLRSFFTSWKTGSSERGPPVKVQSSDLLPAVRLHLLKFLRPPKKEQGGGHQWLATKYTNMSLKKSSYVQVLRMLRTVFLTGTGYTLHSKSGGGISKSLHIAQLESEVQKIEKCWSDSISGSVMCLFLTIKVVISGSRVYGCACLL